MTWLLIESPHFANRGGFNDAGAVQRGLSIVQAMNAR